MKAKWRELFETEPPAYNRRFLESRLAYRIQELAYGGLSRQTLDRLQVMAKQYATRDAPKTHKARPVHRPISGTKLILEWQGVEHCVTVRADDFEYMGRPYKSLSSVAHAHKTTVPGAVGRSLALVTFRAGDNVRPRMPERRGAGRDRVEGRNLLRTTARPQ